MIVPYNLTEIENRESNAVVSYTGKTLCYAHLWCICLKGLHNKWHNLNIQFYLHCGGWRWRLARDVVVGDGPSQGCYGQSSDEGTSESWGRGWHQTDCIGGVRGLYTQGQTSWWISVTFPSLDTIRYVWTVPVLIPPRELSINQLAID